MSYYGTLSEANTYFANRLHSESWEDSDAADRPKALTEATRIIDSLNYRGVKHSVWLEMYTYNSAAEMELKKLTNTPNRAEVITADATQELEFPRGKDTEVPQEIEWACYEIALALIEGFDPEDAIDRLDVKQQVYASVRTTYSEGMRELEYLSYGIPTARVWRWLKPYLADADIVRLSRVN